MRAPPPSAPLAAAPSRLGAVVAVLVLAASSTGARAAPAVFAGVAVRDPAADAQAERMAVALAQVLERRGVTDLGTPPLPVVAELRDPLLIAAVDAAVARYQEADFVRAAERADDAIGRFEQKLAFVENGPWDLYARALLVKSLAERKQGRDDAADAALRRMAATRPKAQPDPSLATPSLLARYQELLDALFSRPRVQLEITATPPGASVWVDGEPRGRAPVVVRDLLPGRHFVALERDGVFVHKGVDVEADLRLTEVVGDARLEATKDLRAALAARADAQALVDKAGLIGPDVLVGLLVPASGTARARLVLLRVAGGQLSIAGTVLDDKGALKARVAPVADALLDGVVSEEGTWIPAADGSPRAAVFEAPGIEAPVTPAEESDGTWLVVAGVGVGVVVVVVAAVVATVLALQSAEDVEVVVDASKL